MAALSVETIRQRISDWLLSLQRESGEGFRIPPPPQNRLLQSPEKWNPSEGHLIMIRDENQYNSVSNKWGFRSYYYEGPGAYELQRVQGMCGCRYVTLRRVAVLVSFDMPTVDADDCQEPAWGPDIQEAGRWRVPQQLYVGVGEEHTIN